MSQPVLTLEQQANIQIFKAKCRSLSKEQAVELLGDLYKTSVEKEEFYKQFLLSQLGVLPPSLGDKHE
jgi:Phycobilisome degradation protein nblA